MYISMFMKIKIVMNICMINRRCHFLLIDGYASEFVIAFSISTILIEKIHMLHGLKFIEITWESTEL